VSFPPSLRTLLASLALAGAFLSAQGAAAEPVKVKVFVAAMFEIGKNTGDRAGEFQHWYERYWMDSPPMPVRGALNPVFCNADGICGAILGMGKVASSSSMQAILLNPQFDFSQAYYILSGVGGIPPSRGTIGEVVWATWLGRRRGQAGRTFVHAAKGV
jgi:purine nucleoside permease